MEQQIDEGLKQDRTIDITTIGRKTGAKRRIEIWFFNIDGRIYITGSPGTRGWYANIMANPKITFHLKCTVRGNIPGRAHPVTDTKERQQVLLAIFDELDGDRDLDMWISRSPLVEVDLCMDKAKTC